MSIAQQLLVPHWRSGGIIYLLRDDFTTDRAAGAVSGTAAEPGPGTRTIADTAGTNVPITSGELSITGTGTWEQAGIYYADVPITRQPGRLLRYKFKTNSTVFFGFRTNAGVQFANHNNVGMQRIATGSKLVPRRTTDGGSPQIWNLSSSIYYTIYTVLRNNGRFVFLKPADDGIIRLRWIDEWDATATLYMGCTVNNNNTLLDDIKIPNQFYSVQFDASDSFNRDDGAIGATDGAGHTEANSGSGKAWLPVAGTWGVASNVAACSALSGGGLGIATIAASAIHQFVRAKVTVAGGQGGIILRYADADNYVYAYHDGTNVALIKRVAGVESNAIAPVAKTYSAGAYLTVIFDGTLAYLFYNDGFVNSATISDASLQTGTACGLYTTNTGNTFDDFIALPSRGYTDLDLY